jgi:hypothetical protein
MKLTTMVLAAAAAMIASSQASAQYGRLVPPAKVAALHASACAGTAPDFATALPKLAALRKWDEYGRSAKARPGDRAWLVSLDGQPTIVDISREGTKQRCSVNAVTAPAGLLSIVRTQQKRRPDRVVKNAVSGDVNIWRINPKTVVTVTVPMGQAIGRITMETMR